MRKLFLVSVLLAVALVVGLVAIDNYRNQTSHQQVSTQQNTVR